MNGLHAFLCIWLIGAYIGACMRMNLIISLITKNDIMVAGCIGEVYHIFCIFKNPHLCRHVTNKRSLTYWITARVRQYMCNCRYRDAKSTGNICLRSPPQIKICGDPRCFFAEFCYFLHKILAYVKKKQYLCVVKRKQEDFL